MTDEEMAVHTIQDVEKAEKWRESVDRVLATSAALKGNVKAFEEGGSSAEASWEAVVAMRTALKAAMREEHARFVAACTPPAQQKLAIDDEEKPRGPKALPPHARQLGDGKGH